MSYSLRIGQAVLVEYRGTYLVDVEEAVVKGSPSFVHDSPDESNGRGSATLAWSEFSRKAGLDSFFYEPGFGLIRDGETVRISGSHLDQIREAVLRWKAENPAGIPGFCGCSTCDPISRNPHPHLKEMDTTLARLLWLEFWFEWALKNCLKPAFRS
jgi:hypothetical protein